MVFQGYALRILYIVKGSTNYYLKVHNSQAISGTMSSCGYRLYTLFVFDIFKNSSQFFFRISIQLPPPPPKKPHRVINWLLFFSCSHHWRDRHVFKHQTNTNNLFKFRFQLKFPINYEAAMNFNTFQTDNKLIMQLGTEKLWYKVTYYITTYQFTTPVFCNHRLPLSQTRYQTTLKLRNGV